VRRTAGGPITCVKQCNDLYKPLFVFEQRLHNANVANCQALPNEEKGACLEAEGARHSAEMDRLGQAKIECQEDCHRQGAGSAG